MKIISQLWHNFIHWKGWSAFVHWKGWHTFAHWPGWNKIFLPHPTIIVLAAVLSTAGLIWVFSTGMDEHPAAYVIYVFSFYTLTAVILRMPKIISIFNHLLHRNRMTHRILTDGELRFLGKLYIKQFINLGYGVLKTAGGFLYASSWLLTDGLYNLVQALIELLLILHRKKSLLPQAQWKSFRLSGWLMLVMHLFMTGPIFLMIYRNPAETYPDIVVIATAAFSFYKLISASLGVAKDRAHKAPVDSAVRLLGLSQALFSLFSLQVSMFHTFGSDFASQRLMNLLSGTGISLLVICTGIYMVCRAKRELKNL